MSTLKKYKDNELLKEVLRLTYDKTITFGISLKNINTESLNSSEDTQDTQDLKWATDNLNVLRKREITGNTAKYHLVNILKSLAKTERTVVERIINRDQRINLGTTNINKVFPKLITKLPYMRCSLMDKIDRITYPCYADLKADGTYRSLVIDNSDVQTYSRAGLPDNFTKFYSIVEVLPDGVYIGEFLIHSLPGSKNRIKANGLINSDVEQDDMYFVVWDYLTLEEWNAKKSSVPYEQRRQTLQDNLDSAGISSEVISRIDSKVVYNFEEAQEFYNEQINKGLEGVVLKNMNTPFKDGTSPTQIKMKEVAVAEFIITDFQEGEGRLKGTLGSMYYTSSDDLVQGKMGGFDDSTRKYIWENRETLKGSIVSVKYNGITKAKGKDTFSLMFANFEELRPEKSEADDLEYIKNALK